MSRIHSTPKEAYRELVRETFRVGGHTVTLDRPVGLDRLFDHPAVRSAYAADEYIPYWADVWPAAFMLAETVAAETWPPRTEALELGCGLGLSGIVALACGLRVTFSDVDEGAVQLAAANARLNGLLDFETAAIDVRAAPDRQYPLILAADVCYELRLTEAIAGYISEALPPGGLALVTDTDRVSARPFRHHLESYGLQVQVKQLKTTASGTAAKGQLYRIRQP